jgi:hypothetical protein
VETVIGLSESPVAEFLLNLAENAEINVFPGCNSKICRIPLEKLFGVGYKLKEEPVSSSPAGLGSPA